MCFLGFEGQTQHIQFDEEMLGFFVKFGGSSTKMLSYSWWFRNPGITSWCGKYPIDFPVFYAFLGGFLAGFLNRQQYYRDIKVNLSKLQIVSHLQLFRFRSLFSVTKKTDPLGIGIILICHFVVNKQPIQGTFKRQFFWIRKVRVVFLLLSIWALAWSKSSMACPGRKLYGSGGCASGWYNKFPWVSRIGRQVCASICIEETFNYLQLGLCASQPIDVCMKFAIIYTHTSHPCYFQLTWAVSSEHWTKKNSLRKPGDQHHIFPVLSIPKCWRFYEASFKVNQAQHHQVNPVPHINTL